MGYGAYCSSDRAARSVTSGYATKSRDEVFTQQKERRVHDSMDPKDIRLRECRDSEAHPNTVPIVLCLDLTGSMGHIPHDLVKTGLPTLMSGLIQGGIQDASLLFIGVGDHECDHYPLQVAQFESGDEELDMWLTRTYIEGGGGGNAGESYLLPWQFVANHVETDSWDKRNEKGFLFTVGDEPNLRNLPASALKEIYGDDYQAQNTSSKDLLEAVREKFHVFHIHLNHSRWGGEREERGWKAEIGQNLIELSDYTKVPQTIIDTVMSHAPAAQLPTEPLAVDNTPPIAIL